MREQRRFITFCIILALGTIKPVQSFAACRITGAAPGAGLVIVCDGTDNSGIFGGNGNDMITVNTGAGVSKTDQKTTDATATASAATVVTRGGDDQVTNTGTISTNAGLTINAEGFIATVLGGNQADVSVSGSSTATGVDGGSSILKDSITNNGTIGVTATSTVRGGQVQLDLFDVTAMDASLSSTATATGIRGMVSNEISNSGTISATSSASVTAWTGEVNVLDQATANTTITPTATSTGILGGSGYDKITNTGAVNATATSNATLPIVELNLVDLAIAGGGIGTETEPMKAQATGIDTGNGGCEITNSTTGRISAQANANANVENVVLTLYDFTITADMRKNGGSIATHVDVIATGINGGDGNDTITNNGEISSTAITSVVSVGLGVGAEGVPSGFTSPSSDFYKPLITQADATITGKTTATGIESGAGNDTIVNTGTITVHAGPTGAEPTVTSVGASISFPLLELTGLSDWLKQWNNLVDYPPAIAVAGAGTSAEATAAGINAGEGNDTVTNGENPGATINVTAKSLATTDQASVSLQNVKSEGGTGWSMNLDLALAKATTKAAAIATGIDGAGGDDIISNKGSLGVAADATAVGTAVSVVAELLKGMNQEKKGLELLGVAAAVTNVATEATSSAAGIYGAAGNDTIYNFGTMNVDANAFSHSLSADVSVQGEIKGLGGGVTFADTSTTSTAVTIGISGGDGEDHIMSGIGTGVPGSGSLHVHADADVYAESFTVTVQKGSKGIEIGGALTTGSATATATAIGIDGGTGKDSLLNEAYGSMDVRAEATANNLSATVDVQSGVKGFGVGVALIDTTTLTTATATGFSGGDGDDSIVNNALSTLTTYADSNAYAESFAVTVQGESTGLVLGGALALASTTANATAVGIDGGLGKDEIRNRGMVDVTTEATTNNLAVAVDVQGTVNGVGLGVAFTDASSKAVAETSGVTGGSGDDGIYNSADSTIKAYADANAYADLFSVNVQGNSTGIVIGGTIALADSRATATATGIDSGTGKDTISNEAYGTVDATATATANSLAFAATVQGAVEGFGGQAALTDTSTFSTATATGLSGGDDQDTIANSTRAILKSHATAKAYAESITVNVQGSTTGVTLSGSLARGNTTPTATATGISGGAGTDTLSNDGFMDVQAVTDSTSVAVAARAVGVIEGISVGASLTDTSTTANATATGIDGGADNDTISNYRSIMSKSDSTLRAAAVSVDFGGVPIGISVGAALSKAAANATGTAKGINGGTGNDTITNASYGMIDVDSTAHSTSTAVSISANVIGAAWTDTSATTLTRATGIAGDAGNNRITNLGTIDTDSNATANVANVSVNLIGATPVNGWTSSTADAAGIDSGTGSNWVENQRTITADAIATTNATGVAVQVAGYSDMDITTNAIAAATGIIGGGGADTITNTKTGSIQATATADADATAVDINLLGYSTADGKSTGTATVRGIDGGDGINTITNLGSIIGTATVTADAKSYEIQLAGGAQATAGTEATATTIGFFGGKDTDTLRNEGTINLTSQSTLNAQSRSYKIAGVGLADASSKALAFTTGIDGAEGGNYITNASTGSISTTANASADAGSITGVAIGIAGASANTTSLAHSTGLKSGSGQDTMINYGTLNVIAASTTTAVSGSFSLIGLSFGDSLTTAITDGINAGGGNDFIRNTGVITVGSVLDNDNPMSYSKVISATISLGSISSAELGAKSEASGIIGGTGDDTIRNEGTITVGSEYWMSKGYTYGFIGSLFGLSSVATHADTISRGMDGGTGANTLVNDATGLLTVRASSFADANGVAKTLVGAIAEFTSAESTASATGIIGGTDTDTVDNKGTIYILAHTWARSVSDSRVGWGNPTADASATATAEATGILSGGGHDLVANSGMLTVRALAEANPYANADSDIAETFSTSSASSIATASGIATGNDATTVNNTATGSITVLANANSYDALNKQAGANSDENATANAMLTSNASGIKSGNGGNLLYNDGQITVTAEVNAKTHATASSVAATATSTANAGGSATATGIAAGDGNNSIRNGGALTITAITNGTALSDYPSDHLDRAMTHTGAGDFPLTSSATGISVGRGENLIENNGTIVVSSTVSADARSYSNTVTTTTYSNAYAGGNAAATGIFAGNAQNVINNHGTLSVTAAATAKAWGIAEEYGYAYIGSAGSAGIIAEAVGISAGSGNNQITNYGTLDVKATASASVETAGSKGRDSFSESSATATGIRTGDGNNSITNLGTIGVTATGTMTRSVAIQTGAGNDTVSLGKESITTGTISLGAGDDTLKFLGTAVVNGTMDPGSGSNTLVFDGTGTLGYSFSGFENTVKQGAGTFTLANLPTMKNLTISKGTLHLGQSYSMAANGLFRTTINSDGSAGLLSVDGTVSLGGALNVTKGPGYYYNGTTHSIITGNVLTGSFADIMLPESKALVSFSMHQMPGAVQIETQARNFTTVATNPVEMSVAEYLDRIQGTASGDLLNMLGHFQNLDTSRFGQGFSSLSPASYDSYSQISLNSTRHAMVALQRQMGMARFYANAAGHAIDSTPVLLAFAGSDVNLSPIVAKGNVPGGQNKYRGWISGYRQWGDQKDTTGYPGYNYRINSGSMGFDYTFPTDILLGLSFNSAIADIDLNRHAGSGTINSYSGALYGSYFTGNSYLEGALSYGSNHYRNNRYLTIGPIQSTAYSKHDGDVVAAQLGGGYSFKFSNWSLSPIASLRYVYLDESAFTESGADSLNLIVQGLNTQSLVSELGLRAAYVFSTKYGSLIPELSASLLYDFGIDDRAIRVSFTGSPDISFTTPVQDMDRIGAVIDAGLTYLTKSGISLSLKYNGELRNSYQSHGVVGQLSITF